MGRTIYFGEKKPQDIILNDNKIQKIYCNEQVVWDAGAPEKLKAKLTTPTVYVSRDTSQKQKYILSSFNHDDRVDSLYIYTDTGEYLGEFMASKLSQPEIRLAKTITGQPLLDIIPYDIRSKIVNIELDDAQHTYLGTVLVPHVLDDLVTQNKDLELLLKDTVLTTSVKDIIPGTDTATTITATFDETTYNIQLEKII